MLLFVGIWLVLRTTNKSPNGTRKAIGPMASSTLPASSQTQPQASKPLSAGITEERKQKLVEFFNTSINFYGRVVDDRGAPIASALTFYIIGSDNLSGSPTFEGPVTDKNGRFLITGKNGPDLSVWVKHSDYYQTPSADQIFEYSSRQYTPGKEPPPLPTQNNPIVFVLKKKRTAEPLIHFKNLRVSLPRDGTPVTVNMRTGKVGAGSDTVTFTLISKAKELPLNAFHHFDWSIAIHVANGGLLERSDALNFEAPASKYHFETLSENDPEIMKGNWSSVIKKDFFLSFGSGTYGRLRIEVSGEKGRVIAESFFNPTFGSRNLEFDPTKEASSR